MVSCVGTMLLDAITCNGVTSAIIKLPGASRVTSATKQKSAIGIGETHKQTSPTFCLLSFNNPSLCRSRASVMARRSARLSKASSTQVGPRSSSLNRRHPRKLTDSSHRRKTNLRLLDLALCWNEMNFQMASSSISPLITSSTPPLLLQLCNSS